MGGSRESLIRRQRTLALLNDRAEVVAHRLMRLDLSSSLWGVRISEIREACFHLHKVGAQVGNPLQCHRSAEEGTTALRAALAVFFFSLMRQLFITTNMLWVLSRAAGLCSCMMCLSTVCTSHEIHSVYLMLYT